jgi:hypothetical protein
MLLMKNLINNIFVEFLPIRKIFELNNVKIDTRMLEPNTRLLDNSKNDQKSRVPGYSMLDNGITNENEILNYIPIR